MTPDGGGTPPITAVVPTFNEELNIERCLSSVRGCVGELIVVDSGSTDRTVEIASGFADRVEVHPYEGAPQQWTWILESLDVANEWILALDADYAVTPELGRALGDLFADGGSPRCLGYYVRHRQVFLGRPIRHGGIYPRYRLCLFQHDRVRVDPYDAVDNRFYVDGPVGRIEHDLIEDNAQERSLSVWIEKQVRYARRAAEEEFARMNDHEHSFGEAALLRGRNERVLWFKRLWARLPLYWRSLGYFLYRYFLRLGFLDGRPGFLYHFTQALVFRVTLDAHLDELRRGAR